MSGPTPGTPLPWKVYRAANGSLLGIGDADAGGITDYRGGLWRSGEEMNANAAYIVHACNLYPELLEALEELMRFHNGEGSYNFAALDSLARANASDDAWIHVHEKIRQAIAKARGKA